jgi:hypothetical protein
MICSDKEDVSGDIGGDGGNLPAAEVAEMTPR